MTREEILERLNAIIDEEAPALRDELRTLSETETLSEDEQARFDELTGDESPITVLTDERSALEKRLSILNAAERLTEPGEDRGAPQYKKETETRVDFRTASRTEVRDAALKTLEAEHKSQVVPISDEVASKVEKLINTRTLNVNGDRIARRLLLTENDDYRSAWAKSLFSAQPAWTPEEARALNEFRAEQQSLTDESGGFGVPVKLAA